MHCLSPMVATVDVMKHPEGNRAYYKGLMVCGMVWICPLCAARITEERRQELTRALAVSGFTAYLVTYTVRHNMRQSLKSLLDAMQQAFRSMKSGKAWQFLKDEYSWVGSIKSLEVTHGDNGWHPHQHELVLLDEPLSKSAQNGLLSDLRIKWDGNLKRHGYGASWAHGVDLRATDEDVQEYVAKFGHEPVVMSWGLEHELTKQPVKKGKVGGRTPTQLLADYGNGDLNAGRLWKDYAFTFKGKKQLVWSKGLREILGLEQEIPDTEIVATLPDGVLLLTSLNSTEWKAIIRADIRGEVLDKAASLDIIQFRRWLGGKLENWL